MERSQIFYLLALGSVAVLPGLWLFLDVRKRGRNVVLWTALYGFALIPPRLRYVLVALVFGAWFMVRDQHFDFWRKLPGKSLLSRKSTRRRK